MTLKIAQIISGLFAVCQIRKIVFNNVILKFVFQAAFETFFMDSFVFCLRQVFQIHTIYLKCSRIQSLFIYLLSICY